MKVTYKSGVVYIGEHVEVNDFDAAVADICSACFESEESSGGAMSYTPPRCRILLPGGWSDWEYMTRHFPTFSSLDSVGGNGRWFRDRAIAEWSSWLARQGL